MIRFDRGQPGFILLLITYVLVVATTIPYMYRLAETCVIVSPEGIEYRRPEFTIRAAWAQVKGTRRDRLLSLLGTRSSLVLSDPAVTWDKWYGRAYGWSPQFLFFPKQHTRIPLGPLVWEAYDDLESEIRRNLPGLEL